MTDRTASAAVDFDTVISRDDTHSMKWDRYRGRDVLPFWVADMDFALASPVHEALQRRLEHPVFGYTLPPDSLGEAIVAHLQREFGWSIDPEWLVYIAGVVPALGASCRAVCRDGDEVMTNPPIYHHFFDAHDPVHHTLVPVPLMRKGSRWTFDIEAMRNAITERTRLLMLCSPHNPVGTVFTAEELEAVVSLAVEHDLVVVSDEIHCDLVLAQDAAHRPTAHACADHAERIITLMSASKTWNIAGLNCSFAVVSDPVLRDAFKSACQSTVPPVPPLAYTATESAYRDGGPWREQLLDYLRANLAYLETAIADIPGLTLQPLQATYLAWIDATALNLNDTQAWFESRGVGLSAGEQFGQDGFLRLNFACPRATLEAGVARIAAAVHSRDTGMD